MIFRTKNKPLHMSTSSIQINGHTINRVMCTRFLGEFINENLNWSAHINHVRSKMAKGIGILYKGRRVLKSSTLLSLYYSFIYPYMTYCVEVWGSSPVTHIESIIKVQKKAVRIITFSPFRAPSKPLFQSLNVLTFPEIYTFAVLSFMHKYHFNKLPVCFNNFLSLTGSTHNINTRSNNSLNYNIARCRLRLSSNFIKNKGPFFWNSLPHDIVCPSFGLFKSNVRQFLKS